MYADLYAKRPVPLFRFNRTFPCVFSYYQNFLSSKVIEIISCVFSRFCFIFGETNGRNGEYAGPILKLHWKCAKITLPNFRTRHILTLHLCILPSGVLIGNRLVSLRLVTVLLNQFLTYAYIHSYSFTHILHVHIQSTNTLHVCIWRPYVYTYHLITYCVDMCIHENRHFMYICISTPF